MTVSDMIQLFFDVKPYQISGGPAWIKQERFDVTGKDLSTTAVSQKLIGKDWSAALDADYERMRELLKDRFQLSLHHEVHLLPILTLVTVKKKQLPSVPCSSNYWLQHGMVKGAIRISSLAALLKEELGMPVTDSTGLIGCYFIDARWTSDVDDESLPSLPTALHDLGFSLEKRKGDVDILVIDRVERPQPD